MADKTKFDIIEWKEFDNIINEFVKLKKEERYNAILSISKGGLIPGVALAHKLGIKEFYVIDIRRNSSEEPYSGKIPPVFQDFDYGQLKGKKVLVVDDIVGTGKTLLELKGKLSAANITNYGIFVLVKFDGDYSPDKSLKLDFFGKICRNWVIFPWENQPCQTKSHTIP